MPTALASFPTRRSSDLEGRGNGLVVEFAILGHNFAGKRATQHIDTRSSRLQGGRQRLAGLAVDLVNADIDTETRLDRKSTRLNSSHGYISYAVFCLKKK